MKKIIILTLFPLLTMAQNKLDIATLWKFGRLSEHMVSPDGKLAIYAVKNYDVKANKGTNIIYTQSVRTGRDMSNPTPAEIIDSKTNAFAARFTPDGKKISYLSASSGEVQLYECNLIGSDRKQITFIKGGINGYKYAPTMKHIAFVMDVKMDQEVKEIYPDLDKTNARLIDGLFYRHWDEWHDYAYSHLFIQSYENSTLKDKAIDLMLNEKFDCPV
ncbi:MAG: peptidase S9, partial [Bacteroidia bacterium]|nr:peptidase S9 [Bacteroidia bacterium]